MPTMTLDESIKAAVDKAQPAIAEEVKETAKETQKEDEKVVIEEEPKEPSPAEQLWAQLNNPLTSRAAIKALNEAAGLIVQENPSATPKTVSKNLAQRIFDKLDPAARPFYKDLLASMGEEIEAVIAEKVGASRAELQQFQQQQVAKESADESEKFFKRYEGDDPKVRTASFQKKMIELMDEMPMSPKADPQKYLDRIYLLVKGPGTEVKKAVEKMTTQAKEAATNASTEVSDTRIKRGSKLPSISESISAAMRGERFE